MARYIDADALMQTLGITDEDCEKCAWGNGYNGFVFCKRGGDFTDACDAICDAPTVDMVDVVRCKDCKWYEADIMGNPWGVCFHRDRIIENVGFQMDENSYCSMGERREDG